METKTLSEKQGIIALYDGVRYIIYSTTYGVVAESSKIKRMGVQAMSDRSHAGMRVRSTGFRGLIGRVRE